jgi:hypothetical protein
MSQTFSQIAKPTVRNALTTYSRAVRHGQRRAPRERDEEAALTLGTAWAKHLMLQKK